MFCSKRPTKLTIIADFDFTGTNWYHFEQLCSKNRGPGSKKENNLENWGKFRRHAWLCREKNTKRGDISVIFWGNLQIRRHIKSILIKYVDMIPNWYSNSWLCLESSRKWRDNGRKLCKFPYLPTDSQHKHHYWLQSTEKDGHIAVDAIQLVHMSVLSRNQRFLFPMNAFHGKKYENWQKRALHEEKNNLTVHFLIPLFELRFPCAQTDFIVQSSILFSSFEIHFRRSKFNFIVQNSISSFEIQFHRSKFNFIVQNSISSFEKAFQFSSFKIRFHRSKFDFIVQNSISSFAIRFHVCSGDFSKKASILTRLTKNDPRYTIVEGFLSFFTKKLRKRSRYDEKWRVNVLTGEIWRVNIIFMQESSKNGAKLRKRGHLWLIIALTGKFLGNMEYDWYKRQIMDQ